MVRIGCGAGFSSDRLEPAVDLARDGSLDFLVFETIGERTMAFGHRDRRADPQRGYNPQLGVRLRAVLAHCRRNGTRIVTNMGVANVPAAAELAVSVARELELQGLTVAAVIGDDVTALIDPDT
ncbi:MAG: acyclic terpene utilization AtuA family protein, partial [Hyphomicrobiaceae bacterium]